MIQAFVDGKSEEYCLNYCPEYKYCSQCNSDLLANSLAKIADKEHS